MDDQKAVLSRRWALFALVVIASVAWAGCAEDVGDIDRTQPNAVAKADLNGEWYYQRTVVDMPASDGFTFVGATDNAGLTRVRWDIQENYLFARRQTELIEGGDQKREEGEAYEGEVVASYRIVSHFDVQRQYNSSTGEQTNVIVENRTDRPWYERDYMRVDWSQNLVTNFDMDFEAHSVEPVPYYVQGEDGDGVPNSHRPVFDYGPAGGSDEEGLLNYFDVTNKLFARAGSVYFPGYGDIPLCWLRGYEFQECGAGEYTIRNSFMRVDPEREYVPMDYSGEQSSIFGYFDTVRYGYDSEEGIREQGKTRYINRHNIWKKWYAPDGTILPVSDRVLDPIVYHVNRDFPDDLKPIALDVGAQWNRAFERAVSEAGYELAEGEDAFILCPNNPVEQGDPVPCGEPGMSPRLGDIRYSFFAYVPKYMKFGLLGFGPANKDPETGEIISGQAYVYHHNDTAAYRTLEMVELLNGNRDADDFIDGVDLASWKDRVESGEGSSARTHSVSAEEPFLKKLGEKWGAPRFEISAEDEAIQRDLGFDAWLEPYLEMVHRQSPLNGSMQASDARLGNLKDTYIEELLVDDEVLMATGHDPATAVTEMDLKRASVARGGFAREAMTREKLRERFATQRNMYLASMADDALMGLAKELKDVPSDEAYEIIRRAIYTAVIAHEVGHTLGLMHNFSGSEDVLNYFPEYWEIRDDGEVGPRLEDPMTQAEVDAKIYDYAYSSIMDYAGRYTIDGKGVGRYDEAAILFGYGERVEVYKDDFGIPENIYRDWADRDGEVLSFTGFGPSSWHYTRWWDVMGEAMYDEANRMTVSIDEMRRAANGLKDWTTAEVDGRSYKRVPYIYCSHNRYNLGDSCLTRDYGADSYERMKNMLDDLNTWYILRSFPRGKVGRSSWDYVSSYYPRVYDRLKNWNDIYALYVELLPQFYPAQTVQSFFTDPVNGWGGKTWAVKNAFNYLVQTVLTPKLGPLQQRELADGTTMYTDAVTAVDVELDITQGRYYSTSWGDGDRECGYYWWECLHHFGFYLDKIMAIEALTDTRTNFVARSTPEDIREWEIGFVNTFPEQYKKLNTALMKQDFSAVGPYLDGDEVRYPDYTGDLDTARAGVVDPRATFTIQLYWQVMGQARLPNSYDQSFVDESRVWLEGTGRGPMLGDGEKVEFREPRTGYVYAAADLDDEVEGAAEAMIRRANLLMSKSEYCDDAGVTQLTEDDCEAVEGRVREEATRELMAYIELIKVMEDLGPMLEYGDPYSP